MDCANEPCETCPYYDSCSRRIEYELDALDFWRDVAGEYEDE